MGHLGIIIRENRDQLLISMISLLWKISVNKCIYNAVTMVKSTSFPPVHWIPQDDYHLGTRNDSLNDLGYGEFWATALLLWSYVLTEHLSVCRWGVINWKGNTQGAASIGFRNSKIGRQHQIYQQMCCESMQGVASTWYVT